MGIQYSLSHTVRTVLVCGVLSLGLPACSTMTTASPQTAKPQAAQTSTPVTMHFKKGQVMSIISPIAKEGETAKKALQTYYKTAFPLGSKHGLKREGQVIVKAAPIGDHKSEGIIFYSWPSANSEKQFESEAQWPAIKSLRSEAWEELRIYSDEISEDMTLTLHPEKTYTLAMAWINPEQPNDYALYMDSIKEAVSDVGGRFVYKMFDPKFESNTIKDGGPGQVTLVEWDNPEGLQNFTKTKGYKDSSQYIGTGVTRFEILMMQTQ
jgi:uncharacterized protein (DUF1330 family)